MNRFNGYIKKIRNSRTLIIAAAAVIFITAAAAFFLLYEKSSTITIEEAQAETATESQENDSEAETGATVFVDISGCVKEPGVYEVPAESRIFEVIEQAGGVTKNADTSTINQAEPVSDGLKIIVPDKDDVTEIMQDVTQSSSSAADTTGRININTADSALLQTITGIGPVTADKIIAYREDNGPFKSPEDVRNVSGIGEKTYDKMKDMICVSGGRG